MNKTSFVETRQQRKKLIERGKKKIRKLQESEIEYFRTPEYEPICLVPKSMGHYLVISQYNFARSDRKFFVSLAGGSDGNASDQSVLEYKMKIPSDLQLQTLEDIYYELGKSDGK